MPAGTCQYFLYVFFCSDVHTKKFLRRFLGDGINCFMDGSMPFYAYLLPPQACFMFIIAGISPRLKVIDSTPRICSGCGLAQAYLKRADSYLSLFFIPIFRVKKGDPFVFCDRCETVVSNHATPSRSKADQAPDLCRRCGRTVQNDFLYCPYCGKRI